MGICECQGACGKHTDECDKDATTTVYHIDNSDSGLEYCDECSDAALASGEFSLSINDEFFKR